MTPSFVIRRVPAWVVNGVTVTLGLALVQASMGLVVGAQAAQTAIATAVCASLADVVATTDRVARRVLVAGLASTASGTLFLLARPHGFLLIPIVGLLVFASMLLLSWGPKAGSVSFASALSLVFAMSLPASQTLTWDHVAWGLVGSAGYWCWAVVTAWWLQPTWRQFALASTADGQARLLDAIARQIEHPAQTLWQSGVLGEEAALAEGLQAARDLVFGNDRGPQALRQTALLLHLIDLRDLAMASKLEASQFPLQPVTPRQAELAQRIMKGMAEALRGVGAWLHTGRAGAIDAGAPQALASMLAELRATMVVNQCAAVGELSSLLHSQIELLRAIQQLQVPDHPVQLSCQRTDLRRYISPDEWRLASVASNLRAGSPVLRHALRTCVTAGAAYTVSRFVPWTPHPQWIILTITAVMQGSLAQTVLRRNARVLGTLAGCTVVVALTAYPSLPFLSGCFLVASGVAHAFFPIRYSVTAGAAAVMAVLQAHMAAPVGGFSAVERFVDTVMGALLGWAATYVLPIWERNSLATVLQRASEALRAYAHEATAPPSEGVSNSAPRLARQRAYDALRALGAIRTRSLQEPERVRVPMAPLTAWLSAAYGVMSHLSNLRLTLTLHARDVGGVDVAAVLARVSREIDGLLEPVVSAGAAGAADAAGPFAEGALPLAAMPTLSAQDERALAAIPHLAARLRRTLEDAARVAHQARLIQATLIQTDVQTHGRG